LRGGGDGLGDLGGGGGWCGGGVLFECHFGRVRDGLWREGGILIGRWMVWRVGEVFRIILTLRARQVQAVPSMKSTYLTRPCIRNGPRGKAALPFPTSGTMTSPRPK
jgi:hypothetical protein